MDGEVLVGAGFLVLAIATRLLVSRGALRAGQQARARAVSRTGNDPADNA